MSEYEREIVSLIKFKPQEYPDRQDYLAALVRATDKWLQKHDPNQDIFNTWDDALCAWLDDCIHAMHAKGTIPDLPDAELGEENAVPDEEEEGEGEAEGEEAEIGGAEAGADQLPEPQANAVSASVESAGVVEAKPEAAPPEKAPKKLIPRPKKPPPSPTRYDTLSGEKDRYGIVIGTKTHEAVQLYERGTTSKELMEKVGGKHYNILQKLAKDGHTVLKMPQGGFRVIHKDDLK